MRHRINQPIRDEERDFQLHELFFSTTDKHGVIRHGNEVFASVADMTLEDLIGAPHSIIRHPDMPRVVFRLMWRTIQSDKTIAAYVKNLAADGRYYWVLAVVMPCSDGYLSVRLKPSSDLFPAVQKLYERLLVIERSIEASPKQRVAAMDAAELELNKQLQSMGFCNYDEFMMHALLTEMSSRQTHLAKLDQSWSHYTGSRRHVSRYLVDIEQSCQNIDRQLSFVFDSLGQFRKLSGRFDNDSRNVLKSADSIRTLSMNATITANKLGHRAATLLVVADSLGMVSNHSGTLIHDLVEQMRAVSGVINRLIFDVAATKLQSGVGLQFLGELLSGDANEISREVRESLQTLFTQVENRVAAVFEFLHGTELQMLKLRKQLDLLERNNRTLRFVQFAGKKESSSEDTAAFGVVFQQVQVHIDATKKECQSLAASVHEALMQVRTLQKLKPTFDMCLNTLHAVSTV